MKNIIDYYEQFDEWGRLDRQPIEFMVNWHYIRKYLPASGEILDNGAGPGKYAMELAKNHYKVTLADLTPSSVEIAQKKAVELNLVDQFDGFYAADARDLSMFCDEHFHASLMLGPMYHLQKEKDRKQAIRELHRVTKLNGIVYVAFMPRVRFVFNCLRNAEHWKPNDNMDSIKQFNHSGCFNHADNGRFTGAYFFNIEEIQPFMEDAGFETIQLIGSNVGADITDENWNYWRNKGDQEEVIQLLIEKATDPYLLGTSAHLLYIGKKL